VTGFLGFLDVLLRGLGLVALSIIVGGVAYVLAVLRPWQHLSLVGVVAARRALRLTTLGAITLAGIQAMLLLIIQPWALADWTGAWPIREVLVTQFGIAGLTRILLALASGGASLWLRDRLSCASGWAMAVGFAALLLGDSAWLAHGASRLQDRDSLMQGTALHQLGGLVWFGGLVHLAGMQLLGGSPGETKEDTEALRTFVCRFSLLALSAMGFVIVPGLYLASKYVGDWGALVGTSYGIMVVTKVILLVVIWILAGLNRGLLRRWTSAHPAVASGRLRALIEAEVGLGLTVLLVAASLTSLPPSADVMAERVTPAEVVMRFLPRLPRITSPPARELLRVAGSIDDSLFPRQPEERAWSEYNHHIAGLFVLLMGLLAILDRTGRVGWARHWPLTLLGLATFIFVRADPRAWPLGPASFWESMRLPDVLQHRLAGLLVVALAVFEWLVRNGHLIAPRWRLVFPLLSATGGALLLTHSHAMVNLKAEFLAEVSHAPLGLLAVFVGWGRWLELRLPPSDARLPGRIWTVCLFLIGALLLVYRET
jgi:putative copper resistance protein D